jgi:hypothetical protein
MEGNIMKVKCISNIGKALPKDCKFRGVGEDTTLPIIVGKEYVVYGLTVKSGYFWYYICDELYDGITINYPIWCPALLFRITDNSVSKYWKAGFSFGKNSDDSFQLLSFEDWVKDETFYDKLTDGNECENNIFQRFKKLIDEEQFER